MKRLLQLLFIIFFTSQLKAQDVSTYAGLPGNAGFLDGTTANAKFNSPHGICVDDLGTLYIADRYNNRIRKITKLGVVSTLAGSGIPGSNDGTGVAATFNEPWAVACDAQGNIYVADSKNYKIRKITSAGVVTTIAGTGVFGTTNGAANIAQFGFPSGIAVTKDGTIIYVVDRMTQTIRKIQAGTVSTFAGTVYLNGSADGQGASARFDHPYSVCLDNANNLLVADEWNNKIRKITPGGLVSTLAGSGSPGATNGTGTAASFNGPWGIAVDTLGNAYVGDGNNYTIRKIFPGGNVTTYSGISGTPGYTNGTVAVATYSGITALAFYKTTNSLFAADCYNQLIRRLAPAATTALTLTSNSPNNTFCVGAAVTLTASPAGLTNYTFKDGTTLLGTSATGTLTVSSLAIGVHPVTCTASDGSGNTISTGPVNITITASAIATTNPAGSITVCQGDSVAVTASSGISYQWSTGATSRTIYVRNAGVYTVTVTASAGCSAQAAPITVGLKQTPQTVQTANDTVCPYTSGQLNIVTQTGVAYYWYAQPSGGNLLYTGTSFITPSVSQTTPYYIELRGSNGCVNRNRAAVYVIVNPKPEASFNSSLPAVTPSGIQMYFYNSTSGGYQYQWNFGDSTSTNNSSTLENPTHTYPTSGEYGVQLIAVSEKGCADTLYKLISVLNNHNVFIPTTFTPNSDGSNDIFRVRGSNIKTVTMNIFNQWGQLIYQADQNKWDGTQKGDIVQNGTYVYLIEVTYLNNISEKFKGQINVIR